VLNLRWPEFEYEGSVMRLALYILAHAGYGSVAELKTMDAESFMELFYYEVFRAEFTETFVVLNSREEELW
jgi:hypothetical protein